MAYGIKVTHLRHTVDDLLCQVGSVCKRVPPFQKHPITGSINNATSSYG